MDSVVPQAVFVQKNMLWTTKLNKSGQGSISIYLSIMLPMILIYKAYHLTLMFGIWRRGFGWNPEGKELYLFAF